MKKKLASQGLKSLLVLALLASGTFPGAAHSPSATEVNYLGSRSEQPAASTSSARDPLCGYSGLNNQYIRCGKTSRILVDKSLRSALTVDEIDARLAYLESQIISTALTCAKEIGNFNWMTPLDRGPWLLSDYADFEASLQAQYPGIPSRTTKVVNAQGASPPVINGRTVSAQVSGSTNDRTLTFYIVAGNPAVIPHETVHGWFDEELFASLGELELMRERWLIDWDTYSNWVRAGRPGAEKLAAEEALMSSCQHGLGLLYQLEGKYTVARTYLSGGAVDLIGLSYAAGPVLALEHIAKGGLTCLPIDIKDRDENSGITCMKVPNMAAYVEVMDASSYAP